MASLNPVSLSTALARVIDPALAQLPVKMHSNRSRMMLLVIGQQETRFAVRTQSGGGPARGFWQFELGGVRDVMTGEATRGYAHDLCTSHGLPFTDVAIHAALATDDVLAACMARLLLWRDPEPLPELGDDVGSALLYQRQWRPGKYNGPRWDESYALALKALGDA